MSEVSKGFKARQVRSANAARAREETREAVRKIVLYEFCTCRKCSQGDYSDLCLSAREISRTCNTLKVPTITGLVGTWQVTTVQRLFERT